MSRRQEARRLVDDSFATGSWMVVRLLALGVWLFVMTETVTAADFGWLASCLGVAAVCAMFVGGGIPYSFFACASEPSTSTLEGRWSELLGCILFLGPIVVAIALVGLSIWMPAPVPRLLLLALLIIEIPLVGLVQSCALLLHAKRNFGAASGLPAMMMVARALAATTAAGVDASLSGYIALHSIAGLLTGAAVLAWSRTKGCGLVAPRMPSGRTLRLGSNYAVMAGGSLVNGELDKPLLAKVADLTVTGHYALAYRLCSVAATPVTALSASMLPRWARMSVAGDRYNLCRSFALILVLVAITSAIVSALLQVLLYRMNVQSFGLGREAAELLHGLVWAIGPIGLHQLGGTALLAISRPLVRAVVDVSGLFILTLAFLHFYNAMGARGVVVASVLVEALVAVTMAIAFFVLLPHPIARQQRGKSDDQ